MPILGRFLELVLAVHDVISWEGLYCESDRDGWVKNNVDKKWKHGG